jgi:hypothetical protein
VGKGSKKHTRKRGKPATTGGETWHEWLQNHSHIVRVWRGETVSERMDRRLARIAQRLDESAAGLPATAPLPNPPGVPVRLKSGKEWVPEAVEPVRDKLLAIGTTEASRWLASRTPPDGRQARPRSIETILRDQLGFPKAFRGSKQHPK